jgi:hypothetical protein
MNTTNEYNIFWGRFIYSETLLVSFQHQLQCRSKIDTTTIKPNQKKCLKRGRNGFTLLNWLPLFERNANESKEEKRV